MKLLIVQVFLLYFIPTIHTFLRVCYYTIDNNPKSPTFLPVKIINGTLCTHLIIGFASVIDGVLVANETTTYKEVISHRDKKYPSLKVMLSVGGGLNDGGFHEAVSTNDSRSRFVQSILDTLDKFKFDGLDIDWEFPAWSKYDMDRDNFIEFLRHLRTKIELKPRTNDEKYLLSVAVSPSFTIINVSYNITAMEPLVDFINLMSYDFHDYSSVFPIVEYNAPLYRRSSESGFLSTFNTAWAAAYWNNSGVPREKLMIGIPSYTHNYILFSKNTVTPGSPAVGDGGEFTYSQVCDFLANVSTSYTFDQEAKVPFAYNDQLWSSFEDRKSTFFKAIFIRNNGYGGSMLYNLNNDDYQFKCVMTHRFVLQTVIYDVLTKPNRK